MELCTRPGDCGAAISTQELSPKRYWTVDRFASCVTKVAVTRCGNWWCHPIFPQKVTTFLAIVSSSLSPLTSFQSRISSVLCKFSRTVKRGICYECPSILTSVRLSFCPSVCLSHSWVTPKGFKISKYALQYTIERCLKFLEAKFCNPEFTDSRQTSGLERGTPVDSENLTNTPRYFRKSARWDVS